MKRENLAVQIHTHGHLEVTYDTVNRVRKHLTDKFTVICDRAGWKEIYSLKDVPKLCGSYHAHINSPYRNQITGLSHLYRKYPNCTWYGNVEWDTAVNGNKILEDLDKANEIGAWNAGFDMRENDRDWPILSSKLQRKIEKTRYFIGCYLFFHHDFIKVCEKEGFFSKILMASRVYGPSWPDYRDWSVDEALLPSIARSYEKPGFELGCWYEERNREDYLIRYKPDWEELPEKWEAAHPLKDMHLRQ